MTNTADKKAHWVKIKRLFLIRFDTDNSKLFLNSKQFLKHLTFLKPIRTFQTINLLILSKISIHLSCDSLNRKFLHESVMRSLICSRYIWIHHIGIKMINNILFEVADGNTALKLSKHRGVGGRTP